MPIHIDTSQLPLVVVRWEGRCTDDEVSAYLDEMTALLLRPDRRAVIIDARDAVLPSANQRSMQAAWLRQHQLRIQERTVGTAFVIASALVRGGLTAVFWIQGLGGDQLVCATLGEAIAWAEERLTRAHRKVPDEGAP